MDTEKITQLRVFRSDLTPIESDSRYKISFISIENYQDNISKLKQVITFLHQDLEWDGIPTIQEVKERLLFGSICSLWEFENNVVGWNWFNNDCITIDWKTKYSFLKQNTEQYGGGAFISKQNKPEPSSGYKFYRFSIGNMLEHFDKEILYLYADNWNRASSIICFKCGFTRYNFIN